MNSRYWSEMVTLSADTLSYIGQPSGHSSCPSFSSTVIRFSRSSARASALRPESLYKGAFVPHPARLMVSARANANRFIVLFMVTQR